MQPVVSGSAVAARLRDRRPAVIAECARVLRERRSPLMVDPQTQEEVLANAGRILDDCARGIEAGRVVVLDESVQRSSMTIGANRARSQIHKGESLRAAELVFDLVVEELRAAGGTQELFAVAVLALHHSIMVRVARATAAHDSYLLRTLQEIQVDTRRLLARELHDRFGGDLALAQRVLDLYEARGGSEVDQAWLADLRGVLDGLMATTRDFLGVLLPSHAASGLGLALRTFVESAGMAGRVEDIYVNGEDEWLPEALREELFLILREALRNSLAHSGSASVHVLADIAPFSVYALVEDKGVGFDAAAGADREGRHGLASMHERVSEVGGVLLVDSETGRGTRVELWIPFRGSRPPAGPA